MYLHLGEDVVVAYDDIVGIFDIDTTTVQKISRDFLSKHEKDGNVVYVSMDLPKSFVVCKGKNGITVYITQVAPTTLLKRVSASKIV